MTGTPSEHLERCRRFVVACDVELGWGLDAITCERYAVGLAPILAELAADSWRAVVISYHHDHLIVQALGDRDDPEHADSWARWTAQAIGVLRRAGLSWSRDLLLSDEDLAQVALADLARALPTFRYRSRFLSWAYSVIVRSARRQIRYASAQRRAGTTATLSWLEDSHELADPLAHHEHAALASLLNEQVVGALCEHPDRRLTWLFQLWAVEDRTSAEIGALVTLHESRVRALIKQAREYLRNHPDLQAWLDADREDGDR